MSHSDGTEDFIRAAISDGPGVPEDVTVRLGDERAFVLLASAAAVAVDRRFPNGPVHDDVVSFVAALRERFEPGEVKPIVVEAVVRSTFGEEGILEGIEPDEVANAMFLLPYAIMSGETPDGVETYVREVVAMADAP